VSGSVSAYASRRYGRGLCALLTFTPLVGCTAQQKSSTGQTPAVRPVAADILFAPPAPQSIVSNPMRIVDIAFTVMNTDFAPSDAGDCRKIWNHVDEMRVGAKQSHLLARNGLRLGTASPASWPAIQTLLDAGNAKISSSQLFPQRGAPLAVPVGSVAEGTSIFAYQAGGQLVGKSFPGGEKIVVLDYALHPELDGCTDLGVSFEINRESGDMVWEQRDGVMMQVPEHERHRFADLTSVLTLNPGEFLVIGPRDDVKNDFLVGTQFLADKDERIVRLMFIAPQPYQSQSAARPTS